MSKIPGPQPARPELKLLTGAGVRRHESPVPAAALPQAPNWFDDEHRAVWDRVTADLATMKLLARADQGLLTAYVVAEVTHIRAARLLATQGLIVDGARGPARHPAATIVNQTSHQIDQLSASLGLSPSARARLATRIDTAECSEDDRLLRELYS